MVDFIREKDEKLETAISEGLDNLSPEDENYCDKVIAVKDLYEVKIKEEQIQNDYFIHAQEVDNQSAELDAKSCWWKQINPNTVITTTAMGLCTLLTLKFEKDGYLFRPSEFLRSFINHNK